MTDQTKPEAKTTKEITEADARVIAKALTLIENDTTGAIVMPAVDAAAAIEAWKSYQDLKKAVISPDDVQQIQGRQFLKKSYWRKIATFFNLSVDLVTEKKEELANGNTTYHFVCKATAPNGRFAVGAGSCNIYEKAKFDVEKGQWLNSYGKIAEPNSIHNARATAETRAWNRAVSNLVGGGEVSAEEVEAIKDGKSEEVDTTPDPTDEWENPTTKTYTPRPRPAKGSQETCAVDHSKLVILTVKKEGKNKGRTFRACQKCDFFHWES